MRVLIHAPRSMFSPSTGIGHYVTQLLRALAHRPEVEQVGAMDRGRLYESRTEEPVGSPRVLGAARKVAARLPSVGAAVRLLRECRSAWRLQRTARRWTVFHEPNYAGPRPPIALVTTVCDLSFLRTPQYMPADRYSWLKSRLQQQVRRSDAIVTISEFTRAELLDWDPSLDEDRVHVTPLGVDRDTFFPRRCADSIGPLRRRYALPATFLLYLGTLEPRKNLQGLLEAYARLPVHVQDEFPLVLAGLSGWRQGFFQDQLDRLAAAGRVRQLGYVPQADLPLLLSAASLFCFPSFYEGFGLPPLEAASCGTPVLCSRRSALPEVMGPAAEYVDPDCPDSIAAGIVRVLDNSELAGRLAAEGIARAASFSWSTCAARTVAAYQAAV